MRVTRNILVGLVALLPAPSLADAPSLPADVRAALEANARSMADLTIDGSCGRRLLTPAGTAFAALGVRESEAEFTQRVRFELRLQGPKIHEALRYPAGLYNTGKGVDERSFDGAKYFGGSFDPSQAAKPGALVIKTPAIIEADQRKRATREVLFELWYLTQAGFAGPAYGSELGRPIQSLVTARAALGRVASVKDVGQGGQKLLEVAIEYPEPWASRATASIEKDDSLRFLKGDSKQIQMELERRRREQSGRRRICRFLLDGAMGYAVREEWESRAEGGAVMFHTTNSDFRQLEPGGVWLPRRCEVASYAFEMSPQYTSPEPLYATDIRVDKLERSPLGDEQFRVWFDHPGVRVVDYSDPRATPDRPYSYQIALPVDELDASQLRSSFGRNRRLLMIIINAILAATLALIAFRRSRRGE